MKDLSVVACPGPGDQSGPGRDYRAGLARLLAGRTGAVPPLRRAAAGPSDGRAVAHIAMACWYALTGDPASAAESTRLARDHARAADRRDQQQVQIVVAILDRRITRAVDLAFEQVAEFGDDTLVVHQLAWHLHDQRDPAVQDALRALSTLLPSALDADAVTLGVHGWLRAAAGDVPGVAATAGRALRLDPANATAWHAWAHVQPVPGPTPPPPMPTHAFPRLAAHLERGHRQRFSQDSAGLRRG
jgi:hypothetical protein